MEIYNFKPFIIKILRYYHAIVLNIQLWEFIKKIYKIGKYRTVRTIPLSFDVSRCTRGTKESFVCGGGHYKTFPRYIIYVCVWRNQRGELKQCIGSEGVMVDASLHSKPGAFCGPPPLFSLRKRMKINCGSEPVYSCLCPPSSTSLSFGSREVRGSVHTYGLHHDTSSMLELEMDVLFCALSVCRRGLWVTNLEAFRIRCKHLFFFYLYTHK